jgi:uncharacterized protein YggE
MTRTLALVAVVFAACSQGTPQVIVQTPEVHLRDRMTVTGTATLEVSPDLVDLTMTVSSDASRPAAASAETQRKTKELVAALAGVGVTGSDVKLSQMSLRPVYAERYTDQMKIIAYRAEVTITATTKQFDQIGALMDTGANAGAIEMSTQFRRSDLPELKKQVRDLALTAAKAKAEQSAKTLGIRIGRIMSVEEMAANAVTWGRHLYPNYLGNNPSSTGAAAPSSGAALGGTLQPLTLDITISFELPTEV